MSQEREADVEIDLRRIVKLLWDRKALVGLVSAVGVGVGLAMALLTKSEFRSEALVIPNRAGTGGGGLGGVASQLGGLAELAGIYTRPGAEDKEVALAVLQSRVLLEQFVTENQLLPVIFEDAWDSEAAAWKKQDVDDIPTALDACEVIKKRILKVSADKKTGLVVVAVEWTDPALASRWVADLIGRTNRYLKQQALNESEANLKYLEKQAQASTAIELKQATYNLIEAELKKQMIAMSAEQYALKVIDPPVASRHRIRPKRKAMVILAGLAGLFTGIVLALGHAAFLGSKPNAAA